MLDRDALTRVRDAIVDKRGVELATIIADLEAAGYEGEEPTLKRMPRGYLIDHPRADLLRLTSFVGMKQQPVPKEFFSAEFVEWCAQQFEELLPLHRWLVSVIED
jgi:hypothetical protein